MKNIALALAIVAGFASAAVATEAKEEVAATTETTEVAATTDSKEAAPAATTEEVAVSEEVAPEASKTETN